MKLKDKIRFFLNSLDLVFKIKYGKVLEDGSKCYQVSKWIAWVFRIYYFSGLIFISMFGIWIIITEYLSNNLYVIILLTTIFYFLIEFIIALLIPIKETPCWKTF